jgi:PAS domain S-box-containing protein
MDASRHSEASHSDAPAPAGHVAAGTDFPGSAVLELLDAFPNAVIGVDPSGTIAYANSGAVSAFGYQPEQLVGRPVEVLLPQRFAAGHVVYRGTFTEQPVARPMGIGLELAGRREDGTEFPVEISLTPIAAAEGTWVFATVLDISARKEAELRIRTLSRAYQMLAEANRAIVRAPDENSLFAAVCRIAVEQGGAIGAWVGVAKTGHGRIADVAMAGSISGYIAQLTISADSYTSEGRGPTARALREGHPCYTDDFKADPSTLPWRNLGRYFGIRASATLPLRCGGVPVAVLSLYSGQPNVYDQLMRSLLEGLADDVSFALDRFAAEANLRAERAELLERLGVTQESD